MQLQGNDQIAGIDGEPDVLDRLTSLLEPLGLMVRGGFEPRPGDQAPETVETIVLIGNAGPDLFEVFDPPLDGPPHPLDRWTMATIGPIADRFGARVFYPFEGPPHWPFQRWARRAESVHPSPVGMLIHPEYGLWHAYRAALGFDHPIPVPARAERPAPCLTCDKPCLAACPVGAFTAEGYDVPACTQHLETTAGSPCFAGACLARAACPVGRPYRYATAQAIFHTSAFLGRHSRPARRPERSSGTAAASGSCAGRRRAHSG